MSSALATIPEFQGIELARAEAIAARFIPHYDAANLLVEQAATVKVTDAADLDGIEEARRIRLALSKARNGAKKVKDEEKENYLRIGNAIQGVFNRIKDICEPVEKKLEDMEKVAERIQAERKAKLGAERGAKLTAMGMTWSVDLGSLPEKEWEITYAGYKAAHEKELADAAIAEDARARAEFERAEREAELAAENARLKKAAEENEKVEAEAQKKADEDKARKLAIGRKRWEIVKPLGVKNPYTYPLDELSEEQFTELHTSIVKTNADKAATEDAALKAKEALAAAEAELAAKKAAEEARLAAQIKAKEDAEKAPNKEKLFVLRAALLNISYPSGNGKAFNLIVQNAKNHVKNACDYLDVEIARM